LSRGGRTIQSGLSFRAASGTLTAIVGPNGAGKSTLLRVLAGLLRPIGGTLAFEGGREEPVAHYLGHSDALKPALTLREWLRFWAELYPADSTSAGGPEHAADRVGLRHAIDLPTGVLSAGQRRRAGLARLLLSPRPLWLLDEPTAALDREGEALLGQLFGDHLRGGGIIFAATHGDLPVRPDAVLDLSHES
jgi:heme exporter protein A